MIRALLFTFLLLCSFTSYSQVQYVVSTLAGRKIYYVDGVDTNARFRSPNSTCVDAYGNIFVADAGNNRIRKISPSAFVSTFAGSGVQGYSDGIGTSASFFFSFWNYD